MKTKPSADDDVDADAEEEAKRQATKQKKEELLKAIGKSGQKRKLASEAAADADNDDESLSANRNQAPEPKTKWVKITYRGRPRSYGLVVRAIAHRTSGSGSNVQSVFPSKGVKL